MRSARRLRTPLGPRWVLAAILLAVPAAPAEAQLVAVRVGADVGRAIPVSVFEEGANLAGRPIRSLVLPSIEFGWRWRDPSLDDPEFGIGVALLDVPATDELGTPLSLQGYTRLPLAGTPGGSRLAFDAAFGVAIGWRAFDASTNPRQISIGSPVTATFGLGVSGDLPVGDAWALVGRAGYRHWSNGNLRQPNLGLNAVAGGVALEWRPAGRTPGDAAADGGRPGTDSRPDRSDGWTPFVQPFAGGRGLAADPRNSDGDTSYERQLFPVGGLHAGLRRPLSRLWDVAVQATVTLDGSGFRDHRAPGLRTGRLDSEAAVGLGLAASGLLRTGPVQLEFGVGVTPIDLGGDRGISRWSQRLGVHLTAVPGVTPSIVLRALGFDRPDFIEWGIAIR